jgi:hypothetical protein
MWMLMVSHIHVGARLRGARSGASPDTPELGLRLRCFCKGPPPAPCTPNGRCSKWNACRVCLRDRLEPAANDRAPGTMEACLWAAGNCNCRCQQSAQRRHAPIRHFWHWLPCWRRCGGTGFGSPARGRGGEAPRKKRTHHLELIGSARGTAASQQSHHPKQLGARGAAPRKHHTTPNRLRNTAAGAATYTPDPAPPRRPHAG